MSLCRVPEAFRISYQDVQNLIRKTASTHAELDRDVLKSLSKWAAKLRGLGWLCHDKISQTPDLCVIFIFMSAWQKEQLRLYGRDLVCIYSTHNTTQHNLKFPSVWFEQSFNFHLIDSSP